MLYYKLDENGKIQTFSEHKREGWLMTDKNIVYGFDGQLVFEDELKSSKYLSQENIFNSIKEKSNKIEQLTEYLVKTDYIANKLAEAVSKYISTGDNTDVLLLREKYAVELVDRENWRKQIDTLQQELNLLDK